MDILAQLAPDHRAGRPTGIVSVCSAHRIVLRAALAQGRAQGTPVLIEATCNQVNQDGGYTGMTPAGFRAFVEDIAREVGFDPKGLILGGDHLGPNPWKHLPFEAAFAKADAMMAEFVAAGFGKIHLDCSMGCAGEPEALDDETTALRAARLARIAERVAQEEGLAARLYIIGTEVPTPGGATHALEGLVPTAPEAARKTLATHRRIFAEAGLEAALGRVIGMVVQPGVEFGHEDVIAYNPERARALVGLLEDEPRLVFEAHSTDYQTEGHLHDLVGDGFAILKVGPGLTFALREALYGLDLVAGALDPDYGDRPLWRAMEALMLAEPGHWQKYYPGTPAEQAVLRHYSYSDRIRYYWPRPEAEQAVRRLMAALEGRALPEPLLSQFLPRAADAVRAGTLAPEAPAILEHAVRHVLDQYARAARQA
ncbi:D-tagatose-bisphosphate aldolase, class II, non-catalytic subunit [Arsenicitalea aurantiaca]|uniref:D-tagatose-bisphosphate aldolase, class II, non-catalytic subunit n=1 Tax=Arsenicitalea aurantiaca TaxID=1783274 RepID=A0A433XBD8_9HYPH|nr:D-tagatose-bisphosphate aldolase, class II, non-catalytic subunit [Arsenicitalea aurantiaca]RUT31373.1 D-tagatose-bisphosphate aldolase, class II, non-catalytic subunit [Arsenicitalea aurantiaca]